MRANLRVLADRLTDAGIINKSFFDLSRDEVLTLVETVNQCSESQMPYLETLKSGTRILTIPVTSPKELQPWKHAFPHDWLCMHRVLTMLNAEDEVMTAYLGEDWQQTLQEHKERIQGSRQ